MTPRAAWLRASLILRPARQRRRKRFQEGNKKTRQIFSIELALLVKYPRRTKTPTTFRENSRQKKRDCDERENPCENERGAKKKLDDVSKNTRSTRQKDEIRFRSRTPVALHESSGCARASTYSYSYSFHQNGREKSGRRSLDFGVMLVARLSFEFLICSIS